MAMSYATKVLLFCIGLGMCIVGLSEMGYVFVNLASHSELKTHPTTGHSASFPPAPQRFSMAPWWDGARNLITRMLPAYASARRKI